MFDKNDPQVTRGTLQSAENVTYKQLICEFCGQPLITNQEIQDGLCADDLYGLTDEADEVFESFKS